MGGSSLAPRHPKHLGLRATLCAILGGSAAYAFGCDGPTCVASAGLAAVTVRIALIDLKLRIIRNCDVVALLAIGSVWIVWLSLDPATDLFFALLQGIGYAAFLQSIRLLHLQLRGREGLGYGDVKLAVSAGPLLSIEQFTLTITVASVMGLLFVYVRNYTRRRSFYKYNYIPLGYLIAIAMYGTWLYGLCAIF